MDFHALQHKLFEIDPSDPREDLAKLRAQANNPQETVTPTKDYVAESVEVPQGSMPLGLDSVADFAALAGVNLNEKQKMGSAGQAKGSDPMPKMSKPTSGNEMPHPLKDKLVGEGSTDTMIGTLIAKVTDLEARVAELERNNPSGPIKINASVRERELTKDEEKEKERIVKGMKKNKGDFKDRYGDDAEAVMYATATKNAKNESISSIKDDLYKLLSEKGL